MAFASMALSSLTTVAILLSIVGGLDASQSRIREKPINLLPQSNDIGKNGSYTPRHLAGYFKLDRTYAAEMFYFFFEHRTNPEGPLILWMTGGPGCSSELAVFYENGPFQINENLTLRENPYGWDKAGSIIYVDQPVNTGFSYSSDERDRVYDEKVVSDDMIDFFTAFLEAHPEYRDRELYITGESYGGHYVPAVSSAINVYATTHKNTGLNLRGLAIGNGLTDPQIQYGAYGKFAYKNGLIPKALEQGMKLVYPACSFLIGLCNSLNSDFVCRLALVTCQSTQFTPILAVAGNVNVYDIRKPCVGQLCYDFSRLDKYLNQPKVREELGVGNREWAACNFDVNNDMQGDWMKNYDDRVSYLLDTSDIDVMIYAGVEDLICNWLGNEQWLDRMLWFNSTHFQNKAAHEWLASNGTKAGEVRSVPRLSFVKVAKAGHMVPMDQPKNSLDMISNFVEGKPFNLNVPDKIEPVKEAKWFRKASKIGTIET